MEKSHKKERQNSLKKIAKSSAIVFLGLFLSKIITYAYRAIIARHYGMEAYGLFSLALAIMGLFIAFSGLGLADGVLRYLAIARAKEDKNQMKYILNFSLILSLFSSLIGGIVLFCLSNFIAIDLLSNPDLVIFLKIFSIIIPIWIMGSIFLSAMRAFEHIGMYSFILNILQNAMKILLLILLIALGMNSNAITISYLLGTVAIFVASYFYCKYKLPELFGVSSIKSDKKQELRKSLLSYSIPILFFGIISSIFYWIDSLSLGYYKTALEVGLYNSAVPIALLLYISQEVFSQLFFPLITKNYYAKKIALIRALSKQVGKWVFMINLPVLIFLILFPGVALNILFGAQSLGAENALRILAFGVFLASIFSISNNLLSMIGKSKTILFDIVIAAVLNLVLNTILVPLPAIFGMDNASGMIGAAVATAISLVVLNGLFTLQANRYLKVIPIRGKSIIILIVGIVLSFPLYYISDLIPKNLFNMILVAFGFLICYFSIIILMKGLDRDDLLILRAVKDKVMYSLKYFSPSEINS